jgi:hypothetical protein
MNTNADPFLTTDEHRWTRMAIGGQMPSIGFEINNRSSEDGANRHRRSIICLGFLFACIRAMADLASLGTRANGSTPFVCFVCVADVATLGTWAKRLGDWSPPWNA